jgi:putative protease
LDTKEVLTAGDGICFKDSRSGFSGTNVNRVEGKIVYPNKMDGIEAGTEIYRNFDKSFADMLTRDVTLRRLDVSMHVGGRIGEVVLKAEDTRGNSSEVVLNGDMDIAKNRERMEMTVRSQLAKSGDTPFEVKHISVDFADSMPFLTAATLNGLRRQVLTKLESTILNNYARTERVVTDEKSAYPQSTLDFRANVVNHLSEKFYRERGVTNIQSGYELLSDYAGAVVMTSRYCIRRECGMCLKNPKTKYRGKLFIENNFHTFELKFDCANCEMSLIYCGNRKM